MGARTGFATARQRSTAGPGHRPGPSIVVLHYDQRGRGRSADGVRPDEVTVESEMDDLDDVRSHFGYEKVAILGHSWGTVLAMEYASRHPEPPRDAGTAAAPISTRKGPTTGYGSLLPVDLPDGSANNSS